MYDRLRGVSSFDDGQKRRKSSFMCTSETRMKRDTVTQALWVPQDNSRIWLACFSLA